MGLELDGVPDEAETENEALRKDRVSRKLKTLISKMVFIACCILMAFEIKYLIIFPNLSP